MLLLSLKSRLDVLPGRLLLLPLIFILLLSSVAIELFTARSAHADSFELAVDIRRAKTLFDARRYRDAELVFSSVLNRHLPARPANLDSYMDVLDYLARSMSQQGKTKHVFSLLQERHVLVAQHYHSRGLVFANSMSRLAEALYRQGNRDRALTFVDYALDLYGDLRPPPEDAIKLARSNRLQYKIAHFNAAMLPVDLSDFYTRCEILNNSDAELIDASIMSNYAEVGVDFQPQGNWADFFDLKLQQHIATTGRGKTHRIFVPHESESMRHDLCFYSTVERAILSAESDDN